MAFVGDSIFDDMGSDSGPDLFDDGSTKTASVVNGTVHKVTESTDNGTTSDKRSKDSFFSDFEETNNDNNYDFFAEQTATMTPITPVTPLTPHVDSMENPYETNGHSLPVPNGIPNTTPNGTLNGTLNEPVNGVTNVVPNEMPHGIPSADLHKMSSETSDAMEDIDLRVMFFFVCLSRL